MTDLIKTIPIYNILTNLIPGTVLALLLNWFCGIDLFSLTDNGWFLAIMFYFIGVVNNRIGSLLLTKSRYAFGNAVKHDYKEYVRAEQKDWKEGINKLQELERMAVEYRSYAAIFFILILGKIYSYIPSVINLNVEVQKEWLIVIGVFILFICSLRKQTRFISKRIEVLNSRQEEVSTNHNNIQTQQ